MNGSELLKKLKTRKLGKPEIPGLVCVHCEKLTTYADTLSVISKVTCLNQIRSFLNKAASEEQAAAQKAMANQIQGELHVVKSDERLLQIREVSLRL